MVISMDKWKGKIAVVTGASAGIGAAIATQLVNNGLKVVGLARHKEKLENLAKKLENGSGKLFPIEADVSKEDDILAAFKWVKEKLGPVHILINNASIAKNTNLMEGDAIMLKEIFNTNVLGVSIATREAVQDMHANNIDGHIVHINSILGYMVAPHCNFNVYAAFKFAVTGLTEAVRQKLNDIGSKIKITVPSVTPGVVATEIRDVSGLSPNKKRKTFDTCPQLQAEDVADAVVYALSTPPHVQIH